MTFVKANGTRIKAMGKVGDSLLDVVVNNSIDLEGFGACEGTLTCSTCHLILNQNDYDRLPGKVFVHDVHRIKFMRSTLNHSKSNKIQNIWIDRVIAIL